ncbi:MAG: von Willebrand factor type A domain-containing protein, partial [Verrucomicrobiota bacterium]
MKLDRNDPRLTGYALDELGAEERADFEQEMENSPDRGEAVSEILDTVAVLKVGFAAEEATMKNLPVSPKVIQPTFWQRSIVRAGMVAAACIVAIGMVVLTAVRDAETNLVSSESGDEHLEEVTIGEFRITIQEPEKPAIIAKSDDPVSAPATGVVEPKISPKGTVGASPVSIPAPTVQFAQFIDPLPEHLRSLRFIDPLDRKIASFPMQVDISGFDLVKRELGEGRLPKPANVHVEQWINAFDYDYPLPESGSQRFRLDLEVAACPW